MTMVMQGVRVLEVAEHTFVPAASALLSDWGADVIRIEHVERGDALRGLASSGVGTVPEDAHVLFEHSNRGKRSLGLDLTSDAGRDILGRLGATADVFLTNKLPAVRTKLKIDVDDIRAANPRIIYVRGTGQGEHGPEADRGAYDSLAFWARAGVAVGVMRPEYGHVPNPPVPGFGDSIGAMTIAGGIASALFRRERTGEATTVDVSLFGTALWSMGQALALSLLLDILRDCFAAHPLATWRERLAGFPGQWAVVQDTMEAAADPQAVANGYVQDCQTAGGVPFRLAAAPVQFDGRPAQPGRAPELNEHGDAFLAEERTCRVATSSADGPHLTPLWFVWDGAALWVSSLVKSQRWTDIGRDPRAAVLVDGGHGFGELRGVELRGRFASVGEIPRTGSPDPALDAVEVLHARKYTGRDEKHYDGRHGWLRLVPEKVTSWDFRKLAAASGRTTTE